MVLRERCALVIAFFVLVHKINSFSLLYDFECDNDDSDLFRYSLLIVLHMRHMRPKRLIRLIEEGYVWI